MRRALIALLLSSCAFERWALPQPVLRTRERDTLWTRLREGVRDFCGGIDTENSESQVLVGAWQAWASRDGVYVTHCIATVLPEDERFADVRLTFLARRCGEVALEEAVANATKCEASDSVPQQVKEQLEQLTASFEKAVRR